MSTAPRPAADYAPRFAKDIDGGRATEPLTVREEFAVSLLEQARLYACATALFASGFEYVRNADPQYGTNGAGFAEGVGASALLSISHTVLSDGVAAALLHQDPRFYRLLRGSVLHRAVYAATRIVITRGDDGSPRFNSAQWLG